MLGIWSQAVSPSIARHPLATDHPQPIACVAAPAALATDLNRDLTAPIATTTVYELPHRSEPFAAVLEVRWVFGTTETSMMMAAFPDCVRIDKFPEAFGPKDVDSPTT